jgi:hypothetical protein
MAVEASSDMHGANQAAEYIHKKRKVRKIQKYVH